MESGEASADEVSAAIDRYGIDVDRDDPGHPDTGARLSSNG